MTQISKVLLVVTILNITTVHSIVSQDLSLTNYSIREGLPSTEVYNVFQDSKGFIWFATDHGVARFDGLEMKVFTVKDGLTDPVVFGFNEDEQQRIWFRTYSGRISYYKDGKIYSIPWNDELKDLFQNNITYSLFSSGDTIYFSSGRYIGFIDKDGLVVKNEIPKQEFHLKTISKNKTQYGFQGVSYLINKIKIDEQFYTIKLTDTVRHNKVSFVLQDGVRTLITINTDVFEYDGHTVKKVFVGRGQIISFSKDNEDFYWVGYANLGVDRLKNNFDKVLNARILSDKSITKVLQDQEGGFWFSTLEEGVYYTTNLETQVIELNEKTRFAAFNNFYCAIADQKGFVSLFNLETKKLVWRKDYYSSIRNLYIDRNNQLWVSNTETLIVNIKDGSIIKKYSGSYIGFNETDSTMWSVGGLRISQFDSLGISRNILTNTLHTNLLFRYPNLYAAGRTGLDIYDLDMNLIETPKILFNSKITSLTSLDNSLMLIGTIGNGFSLLNSKNFSVSSFNTDHNFIANDIYYTQLNDSTIWLATEKGLIALSQKSLIKNYIRILKTISQDFRQEKIKFFHVDKQFIWAVSDTQLKIIPNTDNQKKTSPIFYYEWIKPNVSTNPIVNQKIEANEDDLLQLKFGFISFSNRNIYTRYRISQKSEWIDLATNTINLQSITPGEYDLTLEYSLDRESWLTSLAEPFQIHPPWWQTWYFRSALLVFTLIIGFVFYKRRIARYQERNNYLNLANDQQKKLLSIEIETAERERSRIAKDLHDGISSDLISIKLITNRIAKKVAPEEVYEVETQVQKTISEIRNIINGLNPPGLNLFGLSTTLENYLLVAEKNHSIKTTFDFQGEEIKDERISTVIFRIIQELSTNSIKHARCQSINLHINVFSDMVNISYSDNGIGFNPDSVKRGFGLINIESRLESLGGTLNFESGEFGSSYSIDIPLGINSFKK
jgi:signal transduction histidine kinase